MGLQWNKPNLHVPRDSLVMCKEELMHQWRRIILIQVHGTKIGRDNLKITLEVTKMDIFTMQQRVWIWLYL